MLQALRRKAANVVNDPVLRRWLAGRILGRYRPPAFTARRYPAYLEGALPLPPETPTRLIKSLPDAVPRAAIHLPLPGETIRLMPGEQEAVFLRRFADPETTEALHRFAWLPLLGESADPAWVQALWNAWRKRFGDGNEQIAWNAYCAAERAVNLIDYGRRHGLPGHLPDTLSVLSAHGPAIAARLEYFGEHQTSNHLAANGRGLYLLGLALGLPQCTALGHRILVAEAERIFRPSGVLREESSHYHLLLTKQYMSAWLAARAYERPEAEQLETIVRRAASVIPYFVLPGGLPLIGDVSPDCPPSFLAGLTGGRDGWIALLDPQDRAAVAALLAGCHASDADALRNDGWLRCDRHAWSGLWHGAPGGWSHAAGHGHQDWGSFELHHGTQPLFIDPGRGAYGESGTAAHFRSAHAHNGIVIDGADPYPANKPYYDDTFRREVAGPSPRLRPSADGVIAQIHGFQRLGGVGTVTRHWRFFTDRLVIEDAVEGEGQHSIVRYLHTQLATASSGTTATLESGAGRIVVEADGLVSVDQSTRWTAYGAGHPAHRLCVAVSARLPWRGVMTVSLA
jgi:hypothetical protein